MCLPSFSDWLLPPAWGIFRRKLLFPPRAIPDQWSENTSDPAPAAHAAEEKRCCWSSRRHQLRSKKHRNGAEVVLNITQALEVTSSVTWLHTGDSDWPQIRNHTLSRWAISHIPHCLIISFRVKYPIKPSLPAWDFWGAAMIAVVGPLLWCLLIILCWFIPSTHYLLWPTSTWVSPINHLAVQSWGLSVEECSINSPYRGARCRQRAAADQREHRPHVSTAATCGDCKHPPCFQCQSPDS